MSRLGTSLVSSSTAWRAGLTMIPWEKRKRKLAVPVQSVSSGTSGNATGVGADGNRFWYRDMSA